MKYAVDYHYHIDVEVVSYQLKLKAYGWYSKHKSYIKGHARLKLFQIFLCDCCLHSILSCNEYIVL